MLPTDLQEDFYSASLYFVMTIFCTVGFGNIAPWNVSEQIFCVIVMLIGGGIIIFNADFLISSVIFSSRYFLFLLNLLLKIILRKILII